VANFDFTVADDVDVNTTTFEDNDLLPTRIKTIVIRQHADNDAVLNDWTKIIAGAELQSGILSVTIGPSDISATSMTFNIDPNTMGFIADGSSRTYTLKVWLKNPVDPSIADAIDNKDPFSRCLLQT
jgi:hypothetical protein